ncbi:sporulation delaying protein family toxin (plasmid) [Niallia sp. XMNu-256]|uniref:sporulation delaying protein family toxin n=1 Tax=Niallia sp. XMNu-256 TaxID=3082444 RepID=UPI0030D4F2EB
MKKALSLILVFALFLSSLSAVNVQVAEAKTKDKDYTGQELFEGIFFGYGEVSESLSDFWETALPEGYTYSKEEINRIKSIEKQLVRNDPHFFKNFKKGIESGDHFVIEETIAETEKALAKIFEKEIAQEREALAQEDSKVTQSISNDEAQALAVKPGFALWVAYSYVGATHIAAVFVVTVVAVGTKFVGPSSAVEADNLLSREMYVDSIAENLN